MEEGRKASFAERSLCAAAPVDPSDPSSTVPLRPGSSQGRPHPALGLLQRLTVQQRTSCGQTDLQKANRNGKKEIWGQESMGHGKEIDKRYSSYSGVAKGIAATYSLKSDSRRAASCCKGLVELSCICLELPERSADLCYEL